MQYRRLEEAALNAWPALQQVVYDGWLLRFANGYTRRANSVNSLYPSRRSPQEKIAFCEQLYQAKSLPCIFRLTSVSPSWGSMSELDARLQQRGYTLQAPSLVQHCDIQHHAHAPESTAASRAHVHHIDLDNWLDSYYWLRGTVAVDALAERHAHRAILQSITLPCLFATLHRSTDGQLVACGLGVQEQHYFGLFDLVTAAPQRNQGYGELLVSAMLQWARERNTQHAYLQVTRSNAPARHLYARLGFQPIYTYWYRVAPA